MVCLCVLLLLLGTMVTVGFYVSQVYCCNCAGCAVGTDVSMCVYVLCSRALMRFAWWALTVHGALLFRVGLCCGSCGFVYDSVVFMWFSVV